MVTCPFPTLTYPYKRVRIRALTGLWACLLVRSSRYVGIAVHEFSLTR